MNLYDCKILLVDDEKALRDMVSGFLRRAGFHKVTVAANCLEAEELFALKEPHLVLLDVMLPDGDGFSLLKKLRQMSEVPVIFLSARDEDASRLRGLGLGADDYITKPFKLAVFLSRIHALLRRSDNFSQSEAELYSNGIRVQRLKGEVYKDGQLLDVTANEYKLLCLFMENPNVILSAEQILGKLWDCDENYIDNNTLTVYIRRLRMKIEDDPGEPKRIVTVRRMGYKWNVAE